MHKSAFVRQFEAKTLLFIRFCQTIEDISAFVINYFEVLLKYVWQKQIMWNWMTKADIYVNKLLLFRTLNSNYFLTKADICHVVWQNRISFMFYDKSGYLTDFSLDSDFSNILRVHICGKSKLLLVKNVCNK